MTPLAADTSAAGDDKSDDRKSGPIKTRIESWLKDAESDAEKAEEYLGKKKEKLKEVESRKSEILYHKSDATYHLPFTICHLVFDICHLPIEKLKKVESKKVRCFVIYHLP